MYRVVYFAILLFVVYTFFKRLAGYAISKLVQQRKLWITVDSIGFLVVRGIHIKLPKGPVAQVWITEISLGRTHSASKLVSGLSKAYSTLQPRLPLTVRGLRVELRSGSASATDSSGAQPGPPDSQSTADEDAACLQPAPDPSQVPGGAAGSALLSSTALVARNAAADSTAQCSVEELLGPDAGSNIGAAEASGPGKGTERQAVAGVKDPDADGAAGGAAQAAALPSDAAATAAAAPASNVDGAASMPPAADTGSSASQAPTQGAADGANGHTAGPKKRTSRFLTNSGLRLVLGILPSIPLRIKNIVITHPLTGILLEVPRIEVLIGCSRLSSKLQIDIHVQPILGTVKPKPVSKGQKSSSSGPPIVEIGEIKASTVLQVSRQATGLRCRSLAVEVGDVVLTATQALLTALASLPPPGPAKQRKKQPATRKRRAVGISKLVPMLPEEVNLRLPLVCMRTRGIESGGAHLDAWAEGRSLVLHAGKDSPAAASRTPFSTPGSRRRSETQLYVVSATTGKLQCGMGLQAAVPAAGISCDGFAAELRINQVQSGWSETSGSPWRSDDGSVQSPAPVSASKFRFGSRSGSVSASADVLPAALHANLDVSRLVTRCCAESAWPLVRLAQGLQCDVAALRFPALPGQPAGTADGQGSSAAMESKQRQSGSVNRDEDQDQREQQARQNQRDQGAEPSSSAHVQTAEGLTRRRGRSASMAQQSAASLLSDPSRYADASTPEGVAGQRHDRMLENSPVAGALSSGVPLDTVSGPEELCWDICMQAGEGSQLEFVNAAAQVVFACGFDAASISASGTGLGPAGAGVKVDVQGIDAAVRDMSATDPENSEYFASTGVAGEPPATRTAAGALSDVSVARSEATQAGSASAVAAAAAGSEVQPTTGSEVEGMQEVPNAAATVGAEASAVPMLRLLGTRQFTIDASTPPISMPEGPVAVEAKVLTRGFHVQVRRELMLASAHFGHSLLPPNGFLASKSQSASAPAAPKPAKARKPAKVVASYVRVVFEETALEYGTLTDVPEEHRTSEYTGIRQCTQSLRVATVLLSASPAGMSGSCSMEQLSVCHVERSGAAAGPSAPAEQHSVTLLFLDTLHLTAQKHAAATLAFGDDVDMAELGSPASESAASNATARPGESGDGRRGSGLQQIGEESSLTANAPVGIASQAAGTAEQATLALDLALTGLQSRIEADPIFGICHTLTELLAIKAAVLPAGTPEECNGDASVVASAAAQPKSASLTDGSSAAAALVSGRISAEPGSESPYLQPVLTTASSSELPSSEPAPAGKAKRPKMKVKLEARLDSAKVDIALADNVVWNGCLKVLTAESLQQRLSLDSVFFGLNGRSLIQCTTAVVVLRSPQLPGGSPSPPAEGSMDMGQMHAPHRPTLAETHGPLAAGSASSGGKSSGSEFSSRKPPLYHASSKTWASGDSFASSRTGASHDSLISAAEVVSEAPLSPRSGSLGNATVSPEARRKAAYVRARLPNWPNSDTATASSTALGSGNLSRSLDTAPANTAAVVTSTAGGAAAEGSSATPPEHDGLQNGPAAVVVVALGDVVLTLPYDQDPGTAERFCELWAKAFEDAMMAHIRPLLPAKRPKTAAGAASKNKGSGPIELRLALKGGLIKMEHHPMEAWLGVHAPLLRNAVTQVSMWDRVLAAVEIPENRPDSLDLQQGLKWNPKLQARAAVARETARAYVAKADRASSDQERGTKTGALMHVSIEGGDAIFVICGSSEASQRATLAHIAAVDPPSQGVPMRQLHKIHLDVALGPAAVYFAGCTTPLASIQAGTLSGILAVGRQVTAPPQLYSRPIRVGRQRDVDIRVTVKGSRALVKVYTDLQVVAEQVSACYGIGMEATIAMLAQAGKRCSPTDPDTTRPKVPTLPWWDLMRFVWRGKLDLRARDFEFIMAATPQADVTSTTERLQVNASQLRVHLGYGGQIKLMANGASASAYSAAGTDQPAGTLFMLPLVDFPTAQLVISSTWHLPDGRSPDDHHIFPLDPPQEELQGPVDVVALHKTDSISMRMEATFGNAATVATAAGDVSVGDPWATAAAVAVGGGDTSSAALVYLGDHQIMFMKKLIDLLTYPAAYLRMVAKRGTFFTRLDPKRPATGSLPKLLREFDIAVTATPLDVVHYTVDLEDPSCGICITAKEVTFTSSMLTNYPAPRPVTPGMSAIAVKRQLARTTTITLALDVAGSDLRVHWGDVLPPERFRADSKDKLVQLLETQSSAGSQAAAPAASSTLRRMFGGPLQDGFIISVELLTVHQTKSDPRTAREDGVVHLDKPLKVVIQDCRMLIDIDARNAIWGALAHLGTAFAAPLRLPSKQQPAPEAPPVAPQTPSPGSVGFSTPSMKRRSSVDGRRKSKQRMRPSPAPSSELETGGDLLQILLQQKAQAEQAAAASESDSDYESGDEEAAGSPRAEHDIHSRMPGTLGDVAASPHAAPDHQDGTVKEALHADNFAEASQEKAGDGLSPASRAAVVKFEVEVVHLQVNLQAEVSAGRFLLAAEKGQLVGRHLPDLMQNLTTLNLDQVQAHVAQTDIDPDADTAWLRIQQDTLLPSPGGGVSLRRVANPFRLQLSIAKTSSSAAHAAAAGSDASAAGTSTPLRAPPGAGMSASLGPGAGSPEHRTIAGSSGNEIQLTVPEINVTLDSKEFEILTDVISNVGVSPGPEVTGVGRELALMSEAESEEVESARDTFVSLSRYCKTLEAEALIVRAGLGTRVQRTSSGRRRFRLPPRASSSMSRIGQVEKLQVLDLAAALEEVGNVQTALTDHFRALVTSMSPAPATGASARGPQLMLRWGEEQVVGAKLSLDGARSALLDLKAIARKQQEAANASRFTLELPSITWALCHERMPFVELELVGIMLDNFRNKDHSGSSKLIIQRIDVRDAQGQLATTPGTEEGAILSTWNPDASWERDALLRVYAVVGVPTPTHSIYEHVDVMVHPLGVHLTEGVANTCWEYFFPKEDATTKRQEKWVKSVQPTSLSKHTRNKSAGGSWLALSDAADVGSPLSTAQSPPSAGPGDLGPSPAALSSSPAGLRGSPLATHKRHQSWDSSLAFEMARNSSGAEHQASTSDGASQGSGAGPSLLRTLHRKSSSVGTDEDYPQAAATAAATAATAASRRVKRKAGPAPQRKLLFVHVRLNRVHCRVTYKGYPLSFTDFKVLLDNRVYENLEGRWRDLFNRIKWDTIKSVLKSVAGLQGRKFKELLPSYMREDSSDGDKKGSGALSWITGLAKKKKAAAGDEPAENPEAEKARQKQRMLFGQQHFRPKASKSDRAATLDPSAAADAPAGGAPSGSGEEDSDTTQASHHTGLKAGVERAERFLGNLFGGLRSHEGSPASSPRKASTAGAAQPSSATKVDPSGEEGHSDLMDLLGIPKASSGAPQDPFPASDTTLLPARAISGSLPPAPSGSLDRLSSTGSRIELSESDTRRRSGSLPDAALGGLARLSSTGSRVELSDSDTQPEAGAERVPQGSRSAAPAGGASSEGMDLLEFLKAERAQQAQQQQARGRQASAVPAAQATSHRQGATRSHAPAIAQRAESGLAELPNDNRQQQLDSFALLQSGHTQRAAPGVQPSVGGSSRGSAAEPRLLYSTPAPAARTASRRTVMQPEAASQGSDNSPFAPAPTSPGASAAAALAAAAAAADAAIQAAEATDPPSLGTPSLPTAQQVQRSRLETVGLGLRPATAAGSPGLPTPGAATPAAAATAATPGQGTPGPRLGTPGQQESVRPLHSRTESVLVEPADPSPPDLLHSNLGSIPMEPAGPGVPSPQDLLQPRTGPVVGDPAVPAVLSTQKPQQDWRSAAEHVRAVLSGNIAAAESAVSEDMGGGAQ